MTRTWSYTGEATRLRGAIERFLAVWDRQAGALETLAAIEALREATNKEATVHIVKGNK